MKKELQTLAYLKKSVIDFVDEMIEDKSKGESVDEVEKYLADLFNSCSVPMGVYMFIQRIIRKEFNDIWCETSYDIREEQWNKDYDNGVASQNIRGSGTYNSVKDAIEEAFQSYKDVRQQDVLDMDEAWKDDWRINPEEMYEDWVMPILEANDKDLFMLADKKALVSYCQRFVLGTGLYV